MHEIHTWPGKSERSYASATFSSYLCEQMALLGSQDKTSRPPSAVSLMTSWRDHSVHCGDQLLRSSPILLDKHFSALTPNISLTDESFMYPVNPYLKKFYLFSVFIFIRGSARSSQYLYSSWLTTFGDGSPLTGIKRNKGPFMCFPSTCHFPRILGKKICSFMSHSKTVHFNSRTAQFQSIF